MIELRAQIVEQMTAPGAPFAMSEITVRGVPMRVFDSAPPTMRAVWELASAGYADRPYIVYEDERYTYGEVSDRVKALAGVLRDDHGVGPGDRVAVAMRNYPEWVISYWATVSIGAAVVGMNAWWTGPEMEYGLLDSRPKVLIADGQRIDQVRPHLATIRDAAPLHVIAVRADDDLPDESSVWGDVVDPSSAPATLPEVDIDPDDDATIFYTSGTTGFPKGAQLTHRGSVHNIMNLAFMTSVAAAAEAQAGVPSDDVFTGDAPSFMAPTPLFHVTACNCVLHPATLVGGRVVLMYRWDAGRALELIERERVTNFSGVPTMSREMLAHPDWATRDTSSLKGMGGGGAPLHADLVDKIEQSLEGGHPSTGYGLTETHGIATANSSSFYLAKPASCGPIVPTLDAKLVDEFGEDLPAGDDVTGELCVRGTVVIKGYLNKEEATAEAIRDGWFATGDIARIDSDGFVYIVDRAKDMVLRGGENVYCSEVETAIYGHPAVAEVAVFGVPDDRLGEDVACAIVLHEEGTLDSAELTEFLTPMIAKHKIPSRMWFRTDPLPQNANGKFLKRELRDQLVGN